MGCLLLHGFSSMPEEMHDLGVFLNEHGFTVLGMRLAGHATHPNDLMRTNWQDWLATVEDGLAMLRGLCTQVTIVGQSMGGMIALLSAARYPVDGVVAISTPCDTDKDWRLTSVRLWSLLLPVIFKGGPPRSDDMAGRREIDYPAYPSFPTRIIGEMEEIKKHMRAELGNVCAPVLIIHSRKDGSVNPQNAEHIFSKVASLKKELYWLQDAGHSIVMDPSRGAAFEKITSFISSLEQDR
jgi:carboxylesterase